ncbi:uncharacterized protein BO97DRAFT_121158 [Aspergillus homomorphus CBS 101889]|uniref:Uncharacterized protein n=1 Tax=Aspergillus homomorphus (strain CBS 101889) TaxID=1450537 RepID=A0A395HSK3_ASPHC|nr:hypothetical protein BO97DRAFT_121158 [Aspergillus homomorphus CBS 101889]RAL10526.1 hypothetical protein BO97DRAFT_121158 [Aspergillus homomorphus CBS 101889]
MLPRVMLIPMHHRAPAPLVRIPVFDILNAFYYPILVIITPKLRACGIVRLTQNILFIIPTRHDKPYQLMSTIFHTVISTTPLFISPYVFFFFFFFFFFFHFSSHCLVSWYNSHDSTTFKGACLNTSDSPAPGHVSKPFLLSPVPNSFSSPISSLMLFHLFNVHKEQPLTTSHWVYRIQLVH